MLKHGAKLCPNHSYLLQKCFESISFISPKHFNANREQNQLIDVHPIKKKTDSHRFGFNLSSSHWSKLSHSLPQSFVNNYPCRSRNIQRCNSSINRNFSFLVCHLQNLFRDTIFFRTHYNG